jgi:hypothetical protein
MRPTIWLAPGRSFGDAIQRLKTSNIVGDVSSDGALRDIGGSSGGANLDLLMTRWKTYYGALYDLVEGCVTSVDHPVKVQLDLMTCWHGY